MGPKYNHKCFSKREEEESLLQKKRRSVVLQAEGGMLLSEADLEAEKDKEQVSPLEPPEGISLAFSPGKLSLDFWPPQL